MQQVVRCDEAMRAVTLTQQVPGSKAAQQTRTYHFDKVRRVEQSCNAQGGVGGGPCMRRRYEPQPQAMQMHSALPWPQRAAALPEQYVAETQCTPGLLPPHRAGVPA